MHVLVTFLFLGLILTNVTAMPIYDILHVLYEQERNMHTCKLISNDFLDLLISKCIITIIAVYHSITYVLHFSILIIGNMKLHNCVKIFKVTLCRTAYTCTFLFQNTCLHAYIWLTSRHTFMSLVNQAVLCMDAS